MPLLSTTSCWPGPRRPCNKAGCGHVGGAEADHGDLHLLHRLADDLQGVNQPGQGDSGRALLIVVPDRDLGLLAQRVQDAEALGLGDVLQVDAAKRRLEQQHGADDLVRALVSSMMGTASTPPRYLKSRALPSITGRPAFGPMSPRPSTRVPSETTATVLHLLVYS